MRSPWVAREAYDAVCSERDRLRAQVDSLLEHRVRMERVAAGRPEKPPEARAKAEPMDPELVQWINDFDTPHMQDDLRERARLMKAQTGSSWRAVLTTLQKEYGV